MTFRIVAKYRPERGLRARTRCRSTRRPRSLVGTPAGAPDGAVLEADEKSITIGVVVPDLDRAIADAEARGGQVVMPATDNGWVVKAQVADPAGNLVTLIAR